MQRSLLPQMQTPRRHPWRPEAPPLLGAWDTVYYDVEATGLRWWDGDSPVGIAVAWGSSEEGWRSQYLPFRHSGGNLDEDVVKRWVLREMRGKRLVGSNIKYDLQVTRNWGVDLEEIGCRFGDVGQQSALLDDTRRRHGLDLIAREHLGEGKLELRGIDRIAELHAGEVQAYACQDVLLAARLEAKFFPMLAEQELHEVRELEEEVIPVTAHMERQGVYLNLPLLERWCNESQHIVLKLLSELNQDLGFKFEPKVHRSLTRAFRVLKVDNPHRTDGGEFGETRESFTDAVLETFDHPVIQKIRLVREYVSLREKFLLNYREQVNSDGLLRYGLNQLAVDDNGGTVTGRYSSSKLIKAKDSPLKKDEGVNVQQVAKPSKQKLSARRIQSLLPSLPYLKEFVVRDLFVPGSRGNPEKALWGKADARQVEYRLFAHFSNSRKILAKYEEDPLTDFHNVVLEMVQKVSAEINRDRTKDLNFANLFGAGLAKTAVMMKVSVDDARRFHGTYHAAFPEARRLLHATMELAKRQGYVTTIAGRRARFPGAQFLHKAISRVIQGSNADVNKRKAVELHRTRRETGINLRFCVHDEFDFDCPSEESRAKVQDILDTQSFDLRVPILWEVKTGKTWGDCR